MPYDNSGHSLPKKLSRSLLLQTASAHYNRLHLGTGKKSFSNKIALLYSTLTGSGYEIRFL